MNAQTVTRALAAGLLAFLGASIAYVTIPHVVESRTAVGVLSALFTGATVFVGLALIERRADT